MESKPRNFPQLTVDTTRVEPEPEYLSHLKSRRVLPEPMDPSQSVIPYEEYGSDCDDIWETSDLTEVYDIHRSWGCQAWIPTKKYFCEEDTTIGNQFCSKHQKQFGKVPFKIAVHDYTLLEVNPVYFKYHNFSGQIWYPRLLLAAKPTPSGLVVIGRLVGHRWLKALTRREIKRCHNNGLLYKVLPQEIIYYNYHIPSIDTLLGEGFTDYEQIREKRPKLYIKYWKIWNQQIDRRKKFIQQNMKEKNPQKWMKEHTCPLPNWEQVINEHRQRGYENIIVPAPTLEEITDEKWNAWDYCDRWVETTCPNQKHLPHFPPMYLDFPNPGGMRQCPPQGNMIQEQYVNLDTPRRTKHYTKDPKFWMEKIEKDPWIQIYF